MKNCYTNLKNLNKSIRSLISIFNYSLNSEEMSKILNLGNINPNVKTMEYAVRGPIVIRALEIEKELSFKVKNI